MSNVDVGLEMKAQEVWKGLEKGGAGARRRGGLWIVGGRVPEEIKEQARGAGSRYSSVRIQVVLVLRNQMRRYGVQARCFFILR